MSHTCPPEYGNQDKNSAFQASRRSDLVYLEAVSLTYEKLPERAVKAFVIKKEKGTRKDVVVIKRTLRKQDRLHYYLPLEHPHSAEEGDTLLVRIQTRRFFWFFKTTSTAALMCSLEHCTYEKEGSQATDDGIMITDHDFNPKVQVYLRREKLVNIVEDAKHVLDRTPTVVGRLQISTRFLDSVLTPARALGDIHPLVNAFIVPITRVIQGLENQRTNHQDLLDLAERIASTVDLVLDWDQFASLPQLKAALIMGAKLFEETSNFISRFIEMSNLEHIKDATFSSQNRKEIDRLNKRFDQFTEKFDRGLTVQTAAITLQTNAKADGIENNMRELSEKFDVFMKQMASPETEKTLKKLILASVDYGIPGECLQGSQLALLDDIMAWIDDVDSTPNVLMLPENAGVDGSVIASTLVQGLSTSQRLGSFFFFDKSSPQKTTSACVQKIIYDLAEQHIIMKDEALRLLQDNTHFLETNSAVQIYESLLHNPLSKLDRGAMPRGRYPLIIIGCANECGTQRAGDRAALQTIMERWSSLPSSFKLIISGQAGLDSSANVPTSGFQPLVMEISEQLRSARTTTYQREYARITRYFVDRDISDDPLDPSLEGNIRSSMVFETFDLSLPSYDSPKETREDEDPLSHNVNEKGPPQDIQSDVLSTIYEAEDCQLDSQEETDESTSAHDSDSQTVCADSPESIELLSKHTHNIVDDEAVQANFSYNPKPLVEYEDGPELQLPVEPTSNNSIAIEEVTSSHSKEAGVHHTQKSTITKDYDEQSIAFPHSDDDEGDAVEEPIATLSYIDAGPSSSMFGTGVAIITRYGQDAARAGKRFISDAARDKVWPDVNPNIRPAMIRKGASMVSTYAASARRRLLDNAVTHQTGVAATKSAEHLRTRVDSILRVLAPSNDSIKGPLMDPASSYIDDDLTLSLMPGAFDYDRQGKLFVQTNADNHSPGSLDEETENGSDTDSPSPTTPEDFRNNKICVASSSNSTSNEDEDEDYFGYATMPGGFEERTITKMVHIS